MYICQFQAFTYKCTKLILQLCANLSASARCFTESIPGGFSAWNGGTLRSRCQWVELWDPAAGGRAGTGAGAAGASGGRVREPAQPQNQTGGRDSHLSPSAGGGGWRRQGGQKQVRENEFGNSDQTMDGKTIFLTLNSPESLMSWIACFSLRLKPNPL